MKYHDLVQPNPNGWPHEPDQRIVRLIARVSEIDPASPIDNTSVSIPMTLVVDMADFVTRRYLAKHLDELQSGEVGLNLGGWGQLYVGWDDEEATNGA